MTSSPCSSTMRRTRPYASPATTSRRTRSVPRAMSTVATGPRPRSRCASIATALASMSGVRRSPARHPPSTAPLQQRVDVGALLAEMSTNMESPPPTPPPPGLYSVSCARILAGSAPSLSILLTATTIGTSAACAWLMASTVCGMTAVVGCDHQDGDVGGLRTTGTHGGERLVARRVEEGDQSLVAVQFGEDLVGTDVLGDAASSPSRTVAFADRVQQSRLAVVDVTHDGDDRGRNSRSSSSPSSSP